MPKYNWIQKVGRSLVPGEFYLHILKESMGRAVLYILLFILVLSLMVGSYLGFKTKSGIDATLSDYQSGRIPPITITNGIMTMEGDAAVILPHFDTFVVIDDDYSYDINDLLIHDDYLLFHANAVSITQGGVGPMVYNYNDIMMFDVSADDVANILELVGVMVIPMAILSQFLVSTISFFFNSVFLLLLGNILRSAAGLMLKMNQIYHMVIYAMTFSVFWTHFTTLLPAPVPVWLDNFVYFAIPAMILISVFLMIRRKAMDEHNNQ